MKVSEMFPSKYLSAADLKGHQVKVIISGVEMKNVGTEEKPQFKPVASFQGKDKGLVLNKTNCQIIADSYGDDASGWVGKELEVYPDKTQFQGKIVDCLRVRSPLKQVEDNDDIPW